jgi:SAM-dependent methyltransferase
MMKAETIHAHLWESRSERAEFLWDMYCRFSSCIERAPITTYLDIGTGDLANAILFRQKANAEEAIGIDIRSDLVKSDDIELVQADSRALPFRDGSLKLVTMISLIEHVPDSMRALSEAVRVLQEDGELFIQFPNRYFPIELHSGLFLYFFFPKRIRNWLAEVADVKWMKEIDVPSVRNMKKVLRKLQPLSTILAVGFFYPESLLPESKWTRRLYRMLKRLRIFRIMPMGCVVLFRQHRTALGQQTKTWQVPLSRIDAVR